MRFTEEQLQQIEQLHPNFNSDMLGYKGNLHWWINRENKLNVKIDYYDDGEYRIKTHWDVTFEELLDTIENPLVKFDLITTK